ncbi:SCO family protein [Chitinasiproducens palmae]|uniref:Protein SCO1/2 n=1 Tax=Chitinasiproducens palmae TaxID=1770053 RepID=A0A1H2PUW8_9BURK|nr:SCO family protein [Chitinasiproducens palmae]SDV51010.1 protein SCO1/2 [Chitinasiproducens palmae]
MVHPSAVVRSKRRACLRAALAAAALGGLGLGIASLSACSRGHGDGDGDGDGGWHLTDVSGHLPDLAFTLSGRQGGEVDQRLVAGKVVLLYFGYTHCPDVCPTTLGKLVSVLGRLGDAADDVRIVFVTVDPARDTPAAMTRYVAAFDPAHAIGLSGTPAQIRWLAKRYRVAYEAAHASDDGAYEVMHSAGVYVFDRAGRARLVAMEGDKDAAILADVQRLLKR